MQHHAWLSAVPTEAHEAHASKAPARAGKPPRITRAERLGLELGDAPMPELVGGDWLLAWLFEAGPLASDGMGARGLSWPELAAWRSCTHTPTQPWEMQALHRLSAAYAAAYHASQEPDCPAYWLHAELAQADVSKSEAAGQQIKALFGALAKPAKHVTNSAA